MKRDASALTTVRAKPRLRPTRRVVAWACVLALPLLGTAAYPWLAPSVLALDLLLVAAVVVDGLRLSRRLTLEVARELPNRWSLGERGHITVTASNAGAEPIDLVVHDAPPDSFDAPDSESRLRLPPRSRAHWTYAAEPTSRGDHHFGSIDLHALGPWGLARAFIEHPAEARVRVLPNLRALRRLELATRAAHHSAGLHRLRREGAGDEFEQLRDYAHDDDFRHIDWKATARRLRPTTRVHQAERDQTVLLCIETGRTMAARIGGDPSRGPTKLDLAVNAALMLAFAATRMGDRVGLVVFSDALHAYVPPRTGPAQLRRILRALYATEPTGRFVDYRVALRALATASTRRALVVFFTDALDEQELAPLLADARHLTRRHLPLLVALDDPAQQRLVEVEPRDATDVYVAAAAHERHHERTLALRAFRAEGGLAAMIAADRAGAYAVNRYLELKRARRL